jgi:hypothetical protein
MLNQLAGSNKKRFGVGSASGPRSQIKKTPSQRSQSSQVVQNTPAKA